MTSAIGSSIASKTTTSNSTPRTAVARPGTSMGIGGSSKDLSTTPNKRAVLPRTLAKSKPSSPASNKSEDRPQATTPTPKKTFGMKKMTQAVITTNKLVGLGKEQPAISSASTPKTTPGTAKSGLRGPTGIQRASTVMVDTKKPAESEPAIVKKTTIKPPKFGNNEKSA